MVPLLTHGKFVKLVVTKKNYIIFLPKQELAAMTRNQMPTTNTEQFHNAKEKLDYSFAKVKGRPHQ